MNTRVKVADYRGVIVEIEIPAYLKAEDIWVSNRFRLLVQLLFVKQI